MNLRKTGIIVIAVPAVAGFLSLMAWGMLNQESVTGKSGITRVGKQAPEFTLPLFDGGEFTLHEHLGRPVVINFWASWCPPCRDEAPILEKVWRLYRERGVTFIGVDIQDEEEAALAFIKEFDITYPNGRDLDGRITIDYGVGGIPVTFFVDREGMIVSRWVGAINENILVERVEGLLR